MRFSCQAARVLAGGVGRAHHGADRALATVPRQEDAQDRLDVEPVGFAPAGTPVGLQRTRVDDVAFDAGRLEDAVQPEAFVASLVAGDPTHRRAEPTGGGIAGDGE